MGSITFFPGTVPLARPSATVLVYRATPSADGSPWSYELLPNVRCLGIALREGADPGLARFRYTFLDADLAPGDPNRFEQVYPLDAAGPGVVSTDDRLVVRAFRDDGYSELLFDGFVQVPQADLSPEIEHVSFVALGATIREWDTPLGGAVYRNADLPTVVKDFETDEPVRFNPDGKPNATPAAADSSTFEAEPDASNEYPVFLGPVWPSNSINGSTIREWDLGMASRYIMARGAFSDFDGSPSDYVQIPDFTNVDDNLKAIRPVDGGDASTINVSDPSTYELESIPVVDVDVKGENWQPAIERLVTPHGFQVRNDLGTDENDDPQWTFKIYAKDRGGAIKTVMLQQAGNDFDPAQTNVGDIALARDFHGIANQIAVDAAPVRVEASFILAPGFQVAAGGDSSNPNQFAATDQDDSTSDAIKYRRFIYDECGEGHWSLSTSSWLTTRVDFDAIFPAASGKIQYAYRRRPGIGTLITVDADNKPLRAGLWISLDYAGPVPGVWDGTGHWQKIDSGDWHLLPDRLGIQITAENPNNWSIGAPIGGTPPIPGGKVNLVEWIAGPTMANPYPRIMLVCCVDSDQDFNVKAPRRPSSPTDFTITRRVDARDRFRKRVVSVSSMYAEPLATEDDVVEDDTDEAKAFAEGMRRANEGGSFTGTVTIPRLSTAYNIGDKIREVDGRNVSLRSNAAGEAGESPTYPTVVAISWDFDGKQVTTLELSDHRLEPPPKRRRSLRRR